MSQFTFLQREWGAVFDAASNAEATVRADPRTARFCARRALEIPVSWACKPERLYESPFTDLTPQGPDALFTPVQLDELIHSLEAVRATAVAA